MSALASKIVSNRVQKNDGSKLFAADTRKHRVIQSNARETKGYFGAEVSNKSLRCQGIQARWILLICGSRVRSPVRSKTKILLVTEITGRISFCPLTKNGWSQQKEPAVTNSLWLLKLTRLVSRKRRSTNGRRQIHIVPKNPERQCYLVLLHL